MTTLAPYDLLRRTLSDGQLVEALRTNPQETLSKYGIVDPRETAEFIAVFTLMYTGFSQQTELGEKMQEQFFDTLTVAKEMKEGLKGTLAQIDQAYRSTMLMYQITFYLGVLLVVVAVGMGIFGREPIFSSIFGALGIADLLTFFLVKPQERLQASRSNLAQVQAALYNWFMDSVNLNTLMGKYDQQNDLTNASAVAETLMQHTDKTLEMLQKYCKLDAG